MLSVRSQIRSLQSLDLSPLGWTRVIAATVGGILFCVAAALFVDSFSFPGMTDEELRWAVFVDIALPSGLFNAFVLTRAMPVGRVAISRFS